MDFRIKLKTIFESFDRVIAGYSERAVFVLYKIWGIPRLAGQLLDSQEPDLPVQSVAGRNLYKEIF